MKTKKNARRWAAAAIAVGVVCGAAYNWPNLAASPRKTGAVLVAARA
jgi:hypothetical protein